MAISNFIEDLILSKIFIFEFNVCRNSEIVNNAASMKRMLETVKRISDEKNLNFEKKMPPNMLEMQNKLL